MRMQSRNPIFSRRGGGFRQPGYGPATPTAEQLQDMYAAPSYQAAAPARRMTMDDVVIRTAITLGTVALFGVLAWAYVPDTMLYPVVIGAALVGIGLGLFLSFKHVRNPVAILVYAAVEGVFLGMASKVIGGFAAGHLGGGIDVIGQAIVATIAVSAIMLALYKFEVVRVTPKFVKFMTAAIGGFFLVIMLNFVLTMFGVGFGASGFGTVGLIFAVIGAGLAAFSLMLDFEFIKQSIEQGADEKEAWFAAFGLTVTLVWLYLELLRIIAIVQGND